MTTKLSDTTLGLAEMLAEADVARSYSVDLIDDLTEEQVHWRPNPDSSAIGWHLGHQAAVSHYMVRNLTAAEPSINTGFDTLFDSATVERQRGDLPPVGEIIEFRKVVDERSTATLRRIQAGDVGAPEQLTEIAVGLLRAMINHEYQHAAWIAEVRATMTETAGPVPQSENVRQVEGYWLI